MNKSMKDKGITSEETPHKKKKIKKNSSRSDHKHTYTPCHLFRKIPNINTPGSTVMYDGVYECCTICGRVGHSIKSVFLLISNESRIRETLNHYSKLYPNMPSYLAGSWSEMFVLDINQTFDFKEYLKINKT